MADIDISIATQGNTAGAKAVAKAIEDLKREITTLRAAMAASKQDTKEAAAAYDKLEDELRQVEQQANRAGTAVSQVGTAKNAAAKGASNMGGAVLEASRALEDLQYGIRGVLNNLPVLAMQMGLSGGVAGAISIAAVALTTIVPKLWAMATAGDEASDAFAKSMEEAADATEAAQERIKADTQATLDDLATWGQAANVKRIEQIEGEIAAFDRLIEKTREVRRAEMERADAQAALDLAKIDAAEGRGELTAEGAITARAGVADRVAKAKADAAAAAVREGVLSKTAAAQAARATAEEAGIAAASASKSHADAVGKSQTAFENAPGVISALEGKLKSVYQTEGPMSGQEMLRTTELKRQIEEQKKIIEAGGLDQGYIASLAAEKQRTAQAAEAAAKAAAEAAAQRDQEQALAAVKLPAITDTAAIEAERRRVEMETRLAAERQRQGGAQSAVNFAGQGLANQVGGVLGTLGAIPGGSGIDPAALAAVRAAIEQLSQDGAQSGEGANLAGALNRLAEMLPAKLANYGKRIADAELAARRLEERINNLRSDPGN